MNPELVRKSYPENGNFEDVLNSLFLHASHSEIDVGVLKSSGRLKLPLNGKDSVNSKPVPRSISPFGNGIKSDMIQQELMIANSKREPSEQNSREDSLLGVSKTRKEPGAKQIGRLTDIVKEISEKKRQTTSSCFNSSSSFRCRFAINGLTASGLQSDSLTAGVGLRKERSLSGEKAKVNRRKQKPQKAVPTEAVAVATGDKGVV